MDKKMRLTEEAIGLVKETFERKLKQQLDLVRVSAPIAVLDGTGINDDLNGTERVVGFPVKSLTDQKAVVVNSLAKWKRLRLKQYGFEPGSGLVTDMRAIRPDEDYSPIHSIYVDQWDWEKVMQSEERTIPFLKQQVSKIYEAIRDTERVVAQHEDREAFLPLDITFVTTEELLKEYPDLTPKERETEACKKYGAIFLIGIGGELSDGKPHDGRAPDYDDWTTETEIGKGLNGDIVVWNPALESAFEISSMGIRVDKQALEKQLSIAKAEQRKDLPFHQQLLQDELPQTIGGGIGQSRLTMFMLQKKHIGEVQVGIWPEDVKQELVKEGVCIL